MGGGGGGAERGINMRAPIFFIYVILSRSVLQNRIVFMKIFLMVFKIEGIVALTIKGK